eukprot:9519957-Lingulodinium_polyedra.AAC.1
MRAAGGHLCLVLQGGQSFMHDIRRSREENVVYPHGDHPLESSKCRSGGFLVARRIRRSP